MLAGVAKTFGAMKRKHQLFLVSFVLFITYFIFCLPAQLFEKPHSTILYSSENTLLSAVIARDGQWRFPQSEKIPEKFKAALLLYEDQHFYKHSGVYMPSVIRAVLQNFRHQKVFSGASTLTMQVVRMSRDNPSRTLFEKLTEMIRAMRLELRYGKEEILELYTANAPFGGNVVGLDAAAWRYYGRKSEQLSWAESATLAVLPNAPSLIFPGKNQEKLLVKRNRILHKLYTAGHFDNESLALSLLEPLPQKPFPLPQSAPHLLTTLIKQNGRGKKFDSTVSGTLQTQCSSIVAQHMRQFELNQVFNAAVIVTEVRTGNVLVYIGNAHDDQNKHGNMVDIIQSPRSTGSILKPFLYAAMLKDGLILPNSLMPDIPLQYDGFAPMNYSESFDGVVPASLALSRSLNIPAVVMLKDYGYQRFYHQLKKLGFTHFTKPADHYGLSLILGGGEASLWDITHAYAGMSRTLQWYYDSNGKYFDDAYSEKNLLQHEATTTQNAEQFPVLDAGSIWCTYHALLEVNRPETELGWEAYASTAPIAWKTGTSFGNRDAWAVGTTPEYVVGVWVGNADGQGKPVLTGVTAAAPLLFDIFSTLPHRGWFSPPYDDLEKIVTCRQSGMRVGENCTQGDTTLVPHAGLNMRVCPFHQRVFTNVSGSNRVTDQCVDVDQMFAHSWFVLPPVQEYYYKKNHPEYLSLPPFAPGCGNDNSLPIGLIYPKGDAKIFIPKNIGGEYEKVVLQAMHRSQSSTLYWHLDDIYLGETTSIHHFEILPSPGKHKLTIIDQDGSVLTRVIEVLNQ